MKERFANETNYTKNQNPRKIRYIVIHFTANDGDTAAGNCNYFASANRNASAHYFVDEKEAMRSVKDGDTAWHCGAKKYKHAECRNGNSIGIELCSRKDAAGRYYFKAETVQNAIELTRSKMEEHGVPAERVLRHWDVTGKNCPAPFVENPQAWAEFKAALLGK